MISMESKVRLANYDDTNSIVDMCMAFFSSTPRVVPVSEDRVRATLNSLLPKGRNDPNVGSAWIGVIGNPGELVGSVGLVVQNPWHSEHSHIQQLWSFVLPEHRRTPHTSQLISFSAAKAEEIMAPVVADRASTPAAMERFYLRAGWVPVGSVFQYTPEGMML